MSYIEMKTRKERSLHLSKLFEEAMAESPSAECS